MSYSTSITPHRLFAAADLLLATMASADAMHTLIEMAPDDPMRSRPDALEPFTRVELLEAMSMLARMGYLEGRRLGKPPRAA